MEDVKVCRLCLNINVKMYNLLSDPLESYFSSIMIDSKPLYPTLPPYVCYECAALVKKIYLFKQKCLQSQAILCGVIHDCGMLTPASIKSINRQNLLTISNITNIDIDHEKTSTNVRPDVAITIIKKEDHDDADMTPDLGSSDDELCIERRYGGDKNVDVEKVEIKMSFHEELEEAELAETTVETPKFRPNKARISQSRKQVRPKRTSTNVSKKKTSKAIKETDSCSEDKDSLKDITVVTLSIEEQLEEINKRKESSNYLNCPYRCHECYRGFNNKRTWEHHVTKHSPNAGDKECSICKYRFKTKRNLQRHALNHGKKYICKLCPYNSSNVTTVKHHQGSHKGVTYKCDYCSEVFTVRTTYVIHMRIKHPSENICGYCGYSFYSKQGLVVHKNMVHKDIVKAEENKEGPYCAECDVQFISTEAYKRHLVMSVKHTRTKDSINGCRVCGATFTEPEELRLHHRKEHPKKQPKHYRPKTTSDKWPAKCEHCSEQIANARAYWKHFRLMHPNENYPVKKKCVCDICGKRFVCNALLVMHKRVHFGERPYECTRCDRKCFTAHDLRVHQQKHSDLRPYTCSLCQQAFKRKEALERHLKIHSGDNPYKCEICGVAFNKSCTRTLHVRTVHTKEPPPSRKQRKMLQK